MIRQIAEPLEALVSEPMPAVLAALDAARDDAGSPGAAAQLTDMAGRQDGFYQRLDTIMQSMAQLEGIQELARMLTGVITVTEEVKKGIEKRLDVTTGGLFD
jgi:hypothetical protein